MVLKYIKKESGFTLIELAIVLVIIGLLVGVGVSLLPGLLNQQKYSQNQSLLNQNYNSIVGYIMANGRLPLASSNASGTQGNSNIGYLPYTTIGALQKDAYANAFYYAVNNRSLNISINGGSPTQMNLTNTTSINNFCAVLYALNYYYSNQNPTLNAYDVRTINALNQTTPVMNVFVLISSGANNKLDSPNTITNSNGVFAGEQYPLSQSFDDMSKALSITNAISQFCASPQNQFTVQYNSASKVYSLTSTSTSSSSNNTGTQNPPSIGQCISNCKSNFICYIQALLSYGNCQSACQQNPNFCP